MGEVGTGIAEWLPQQFEEKQTPFGHLGNKVRKLHPGRNCCRIVISLSVCLCQSLLPYFDIGGRDGSYQTVAMEVAPL